MSGELMAVPVDVLTAGPEFWKRYHEYRRVRQKDERPEDPVRPDDLDQKRLAQANPFEFEYRYEVVREGVILSMLSGRTVKPGNPEYESNKHIFWTHFYVRPDERRRGIGASWLPVVLELMDRHGCTVVSMWAEGEPGYAFLGWAGAEAKFSGAENRLRIADVDWAMLQRWVEEGQARSPLTRLEIHDGFLPESMWAEYAPQLSTMLNTMPWEGLDHGDIVVTPDHVKHHNERWAAGREIPHTVLTREPDGAMSAVTDVTWAPYRSTIVHQEFTGVLPTARGRGLGKWIKAAMLLHLRKLYPDIQWVATANAGSNAPMLAINTKMGFRQYRAGKEYQMTRDQVAARIRSLKPA
ncbi:MAG TPA: GNAT family N-acetyltransferase [Candidatus Dormibacteraeota bacterium]|nr:GNAT family N-acetyltransferase [Candidatus Dormibacteraeota bacterium]